MRVVALHLELASRRACGEVITDQASQLARIALVEQVEASARTPDGRPLARLGLSVEEELVVWSLVAHQTDIRMASQLEALSSGSEVTIGALARVVYAGEHGDALAGLGDDGPLFKLALVDRIDEAKHAASWARRLVRPNERLLKLLLGSGQDTGLKAARARRPIAPCDLSVSSDSLARVRNVLRAERAAVIVSGTPGAGRSTVLAALALERGFEVFETDARSLAKDAVVLAGELRAIARECKLLGRIPLLANLDALVDDKENRLGLVGSELVAQLDGLVLATCGVNRPTIRWDRPTIVIELGQPTSEQRAALWLRELGQGSASDAELLATRYPLAPALIHHAAVAAKARAGAQALTPDDIYAGIRAVLDDRLGQYAKRVTVTQSWDDLVLPQDQVDSIVELMARVRGRRRVYEQWGFGAKVGKGLGVSALFSGPPGTGKTMVAALIARDLGLELYQVDLGKVVSKWIGETEKNLGALFDAAEAGHAVLLFDEADALFGKRTEVKSSNDRYANLETNYLLQRLETFTGICLLTSNHESNIDPAFQRRLSLHLRFEVPDVEERAHLWRAMLPPSAPVASDLDFAGLAMRYEMSGGYIRNATLRAAFLAADEDASITAAHLERAARLEYEGMGKLTSCAA